LFVSTYECVFILRPDLDDEATEAAIQRVLGQIAEIGGTVENTDRWGKRRLAYEINDQHEGIYTVVKFQAAPGQTAELERNLRIFEQVLRYMTTQIDPDRPPIELNRPRREAEDGDVGDGDYERREPRRRHDDLGLDDAGDVEVPDLS